jgi:hypothetical protein
MCQVFDSESALELNPEVVTLTPGTPCITVDRQLVIYTHTHTHTRKHSSNEAATVK